MSSADDLRRLADEMAGSYEERVGVISDVRQKTADIRNDAADLLSEFAKAHSAMSKELKVELARFKPDLESAEIERQKVGQEEGAQRKSETTQRSVDVENLLSDFDSAHQEMTDELRAELARFKSDLDAAEGERKKDDQAEISERKDYIMDLKDKARELIDEFDKAHGDMAQTLRAELARFKSDLDASEGERKKDDQAEISERKDYIMDLKDKARELIDEFDKAHGDMAQTLRAELARFKSDLDAAEEERKEADQERRKRPQAEIREAAEAWKNLLSAMQAARGHTVTAVPAKVEAEVTVKTVEKAIEEPVEKEAIEEVAAEEEEIEEDLGGRILDLLEDSSEGLKMTQIADMLGIEGWRTLIPVIRELLDDEEIRKEGTLYFPSE